MDLAMACAEAATEAPSSVHIEETTRQFPTSADGSEITRLSYRELRRREFAEVIPLAEEGWSDYDVIFGSDYMKRSEQCRRYAWYATDSEFGVRLQSNACRLRWCPMCAESRSKVVARAATDFFRNRSNIRFLTLTMKRNTQPLKEQIARIKKCFVCLRRTKGWREKVTGCFWALQLKPVNGGEFWHVHLHMLLTGLYVPQSWLSEKWLKITGDSNIVDIRSVYDLKKALSDVVRYVGRPANLVDVTREHRVELMEGTERIRLCGTAGICRAIDLRQPRYKDDGSVRKLGSFMMVNALARAGDDRALAIVEAYRSGAKVDPAWIERNDLTGVDDFMDDRFTGVSFAGDSRAPPEDVELWSDR